MTTDTNIIRRRVSITRSMRAVSISLLATIAVVIAIVTTTTSSPVMGNFNPGVSNGFFVFGLTLLFLLELVFPLAVERLLKIAIAPAIYYVFIIRCFGGTFLGSVVNLYYVFPDFDKILHFILGLNMSMVGVGLFSLFSHKNEEFSSPVLTALFALFTGVALGAFWEGFEFLVDSLFGLNMQRYALETGEALVGQKALVNTMMDIVINKAGAFVVAVVVYFSVKRKWRWLSYCTITRTDRYVNNES